MEVFSYRSYISPEKESKINRSEIMWYFDSVHIFKNYHQSNIEYDFLDIDNVNRINLTGF